MILPVTGMICAVFLLWYLLDREYPAMRSVNRVAGKTEFSQDEQLIAAAGKGDYLLIRYLLNKKADCNFQNQTGPHCMLPLKKGMLNV